MSWLMFVDESGSDRRESPYEVLAGAVVPDRRIWGLISSIHEAEVRFFGRRLRIGDEWKAKRLLKRKTREGCENGLPVRGFSYIEGLRSRFEREAGT